jgi:hypothetical protein
MERVPPSAIALYETLRANVTLGQVCHEGEAALCFHGMYQGLAILLKELAVPTPVSCPSAPPTLHRNSELIRLLANLVLHTHAELIHAC